MGGGGEGGGEGREGAAGSRCLRCVRVWSCPFIKYEQRRGKFSTTDHVTRTLPIEFNVHVGNTDQSVLSVSGTFRCCASRVSHSGKNRRYASYSKMDPNIRAR